MTSPAPGPDIDTGRRRGPVLPRTRHAIDRVGTAIVAALSTACADTDTFRGRDHSVVLPGVRVMVDLPPHAGWGLELGSDFGRGHLIQADGSHPYHHATGHLAMTGTLRPRLFELTGLVGLGYGDFTVRSTTRQLDDAGFGPFLAAQVGHRLAPWIGPYARWSWQSAEDWRFQRAEYGLDLRWGERLGLQVAYGRLTNLIDEGSLFPGDMARVETDGLALTATLRF